MLYYTYIIYSSTLNITYKGFTTDPEHRLWEHNQDLSRFTAGKGPWHLMYLCRHESKREALIEEKRIKKLNDKSLHKLINSPENIAPPAG